MLLYFKEYVCYKKNHMGTLEKTWKNKQVTINIIIVT